MIISDHWFIEGYTGGLLIDGLLIGMLLTVRLLIAGLLIFRLLIIRLLIAGLMTQ